MICFFLESKLAKQKKKENVYVNFNQGCIKTRQGPVRDGKMYECAGNDCVSFFLAEIKSWPNFWCFDTKMSYVAILPFAG